MLGWRSASDRAQPLGAAIPIAERLPAFCPRRRAGGLWQHAGGVLRQGGHGPAAREPRGRRAVYADAYATVPVVEGSREQKAPIGHAYSYDSPGEAGETG